MDIRELLEKAYKRIFEVRSVDPDFPLSNINPKKKVPTQKQKCSSPWYKDWQI